MNRRFFEGRKVLCLNLVSSPGSGKTTILEKTISQSYRIRKIYVIEGDQQTQLDADRIEKAGAPAIQINTGSGCHLDAKMVESALEKAGCRDKFNSFYRKCRQPCLPCYVRPWRT